VALLRKETCNLRHPLHLHHPINVIYGRMVEMTIENFYQTLILLTVPARRRTLPPPPPKKNSIFLLANQFTVENKCRADCWEFLPDVNFSRRARAASRSATASFPPERLSLVVGRNMYFYLKIYTYIYHMHVWLYLYLYVCVYICMYVCMYVCMYARLYVCIYAWM